MPLQSFSRVCLLVRLGVFPPSVLVSSVSDKVVGSCRANGRLVSDEVQHSTFIAVPRTIITTFDDGVQNQFRCHVAMLK